MADIPFRYLCDNRCGESVKVDRPVEDALQPVRCPRCEKVMARVFEDALERPKR